ncbi:MAG: glycosyltransferase family 39 protein [Chloroflexi bacterium]|nr:glycosyltransferase family 39 protein [Chloroflexota bacterium]
MSDVICTSEGSKAGPGQSAVEIFAITLALLLGFAAGAAGLNKDIVWWDELYGLGDMGAFDPPYSPLQVVESVRGSFQDQVPLYMVLASQWAQKVGWSQAPVRYFSLLAGLLALAFTYRLGADVFDRRAALVAVLLLGSNALFVAQLHQIKVYALFTLFALMHIWLYWRLTRRDSTWLRLLLFALTGIAAIYTHISAALLIAGLFVQHLVGARSKVTLKLIAAWGLCALAILPYIPVLANAPYDITTGEGRPILFFGLAADLASVLVNDVPLLWIPLVALGGWTFIRRKDAEFWRLLIAASVTIALILGWNEMSRAIDAGRMRYFVFVTPYFTICAACLLTRAKHGRTLTALFVLFWLVGFVQIQQQGLQWAHDGRKSLVSHHPPLHRFADELHGKKQEHDFMIGIAESRMVFWTMKHGRSVADYYTQTVLGIDGEFVYARLRGHELQNEIAAAIDDNPFLLFSYNPQEKSEIFDDVLAAIQANHNRCETLVDTEDVFVERYIVDMLRCDHEYQPILYENGIKIVDKFGSFDSDRQAVRVVTGWEVADEAQLEEYNVSIQILTPDWQMVRQARDRHLYNKILKWYVTELSTTGLPPGEYRVVVILYDRYNSSSKVAGVDATTGEVGTILPILHFTIEA